MIALASWLAAWIIQGEKRILSHDRIFRPDLFSSAGRVYYFCPFREEKCKLERQVVKKERDW